MPPRLRRRSALFLKNLSYLCLAFFVRVLHRRSQTPGCFLASETRDKAHLIGTHIGLPLHRGIATALHAEILTVLLDHNASIAICDRLTRTGQGPIVYRHKADHLHQVPDLEIVEHHLILLSKNSG
ncbi:hypothetical protein Bcep1808_7531 (plasmid) [Burkholderia vietnamiensis G4]|uniref:Uncharacterized protein n=1 Tax=Burkholderia vietnamiensis (strain G4 / LMG 22486) TaxID=269482 RepID=A4JVV3_BURVG|nr:hypothetical protein Bcep1808_7531 [Burkholderia vietnamiensis G4]